MIGLGLGGHAVGHLLLMTVWSEWQLVVPAVFCGLGHGLLFPAVTSLGSGSFPVRFRGTGTTIALGMCELGVAIFSPLMGWIIDAWGFNAMYAFSVTLTVTFGTVYLVRSRHLVDDERIGSTSPIVESTPEPSVTSPVSVRNARSPVTDTDLQIPVLPPDKSVEVSA